jgi:hypothetical protein
MYTSATREILNKVKNINYPDEVHIERTLETPEILLSKSNGEIRFQGRSMPENAKSFYLPVIDWLANYKENPTPGTRVVFEYEYFNSASSKLIMGLIEEILEIGKKDNQLKVEWHYAEDDDDIYEAGKDYEEMTGISFDFCDYE